MAEVIVVGAGLSGLCCALELQRQGIEAELWEAGDRPGGRVRSERVEGFIIDRGFQVLLEAYPEAQAQLDMAALDLRRFRPGALVAKGGRPHLIADPLREPLTAPATAASPVGSLGDKLRILSLRRRARRGTVEALWQRPEVEAGARLRELGFSEGFIEAFFRPFFGGIFLDRSLTTSSRMLEFVFRMFSYGAATLPNGGMGEIPKQLAARLPEGWLKLNRPVAAVEPGLVRDTAGEPIKARAVVVATEAPAAARLLGLAASASCEVICDSFVAPEAPYAEPLLWLDGDGAGPINNLCVPTQVAPGYGPGGASLVSVTILGRSAEDPRLDGEVLAQLRGWFGEAVDGWRKLRRDVIPHALPAQPVGRIIPGGASAELDEGLFVCGDYRRHASIEGAMRSGREAGEAVARSLRGAAVSA